MIREADFYSALDADPGNAAIRLIFADWLEEQGDPRALGYRWLGEQMKWPLDWSNQPAPGYKTFDWYFDDGGAVWNVPLHCTLPASFRSYFGTPNDFLEFPTRREAEDGLCGVLVRMGQTQIHQASGARSIERRRG